MRNYFKHLNSPISVIVCWFLISISILVFVNAFFGRNGIFPLFQDQEKLENLKNEVVELELSNENLQKKIFSLKNDLKVVEKIARENLGLVKSGDTVFEFIPSRKNR